LRRILLKGSAGLFQLPWTPPDQKVTVVRAAAAQLAGGQLVTVPASLIKRQKQHFNTLPGTGGSPARSAGNQRASWSATARPLVALRMQASADALP
jgi:hypothetical protein